MIQSTSAEGTRRNRILLVDDHFDSLTFMTRRLGIEGYVVETASTFDGAMHMAETRPFDLALIDIGMPEHDGCDLMRELSKRFGLRGVAVTGHGRAEDIERCRNAGFLRHFLKPVDMTPLLEYLSDFFASGPSTSEGDRRI